ncbi:hybrid sensor histidine kinase/response regulator, partial [Salmonella enterica subsp. enterica serovar 4:-:1,2]|nr:hybrid sensor histidine kinase/response regulator [Salmonella enterica subsp. enterica serovar 4:-:1,2]
ALRYTHAGSVDVAVRAEGEMLHVEVIDTGPGIAPEHHVEIFEEFRRIGDHGRDRGMGLGLAIVQRAARMLGHALSVRSALGEGSRFGVCVPVGTSTPRVSHAAAPSRSGPLTDQVVLV